MDLLQNDNKEDLNKSNNSFNSKKGVIICYFHLEIGKVKK